MNDEIYEITFTKKDGTTEVQQYNDRFTASYVFKLFDEPDSKALYKKIRLTKYNFRTHRETRISELTFRKRPKGFWKKWKVGRKTIWEGDDFEGHFRYTGVITEVADDHLLMEADGMRLRIDEDTADMFH